ncbi:MAG TPA: hypothetical protein VJ837_03735, partial [Candidatus Paceibacterota bacterium]|nr:hypothetical protein [Candidatus Paceibacterota bacterium]
NFDPRSEVTPGDLTAGAQVKFERQPDGSLIPVPVSWIRHRVTGFPLNNPGTPEYWEELNQYNAEVGRRGGSIERETPEELELKWVPGFPKPFPLKSGGPTETPVVSLPSPPEGADYGYRTWWDLQGEGCVRVWYNGRDLGTDCVGVVEPTFKKAMLSQFGYPRSYQFELVGDGDLTVTVGRLRKPW